MGDILEFIYTGGVQRIAPEISPDLIMMADYLIPPHLKALAEKVFFVKNLIMSTSDCISAYYFAERYHYKEVGDKAKKFINANFITVAKTEDFVNLSSKEFNSWISSDHVYVNAEEDVLKVILTWIDRHKSERRKYFADLFRQVRLVSVALDYLHSDIATNDLVKDTEGCLDLVEDSLKIINSENFKHVSVQPRISLMTRTHAIVAGVENHLLCYFPSEDRWYRLGESSSYSIYLHVMVNYFPFLKGDF